jgi:AAA ATPase domain
VPSAPSTVRSACLRRAPSGRPPRTPRRSHAPCVAAPAARASAANSSTPYAAAGRRWTKAAVLSRWNAPGAATPSAAAAPRSGRWRAGPHRFRPAGRPADIVPARSVTRRHVLRGRDRAVAQLGATLDRVRGGAGAVVLVEGAAGMGKTRLLDEAVTMARRMDFAVGRGAADGPRRRGRRRHPLECGAGPGRE